MNDSANNLIEDILIVIVIYQLPISSSISWQSMLKILPNTATLFIFDNSDKPQSIPETIHKVFYSHSATNVGVSKAYNEGFKKANALGKNWLLLLDQDTELTTPFLINYSQATNDHPHELFFAPILEDAIGILSPFSYKSGISKRLNTVFPGVAQFDKYRVANSGILVATKVFHQIGGYDERFPLDHSDIYFQEKILQYFSSFVIVDSRLKHQFSGASTTSHDIIGRYEVFCQSCVTMATLTGNRSNFILMSLKRALNLSIQLRTFTFLLSHFRIWSKR